MVEQGIVLDDVAIFERISNDRGDFVGDQGLEILRGCRGLDVVGGDRVEVSPPYDTSGNTALVAANLLYEILCVLPGLSYRE